MSYKGTRESRKERRALMETEERDFCLCFLNSEQLNKFVHCRQRQSLSKQKNFTAPLKCLLLSNALHWEQFPTGSQVLEPLVVSPKLYEGGHGKPLLPLLKHSFSMWWWQSRMLQHLPWVCGNMKPTWLPAASPASPWLQVFLFSREYSMLLTNFISDQDDGVLHSYTWDKNQFMWKMRLEIV